jgi:uncharacterized protein (TIGR03000 family)
MIRPRFGCARSFLAFVLLGLIAGPVHAGGIAFRLILGAPPDPNFQEVAGDGNAALPPRGYSPGYGYPSDYMKMPSLVVTNQRGPHFIDESGPVPDAIGPAVALFRVRVPEDATVWFSNEKTTQGGGERLFVTPPLAEKQVFTYEVRARWRQDGKDMERTRKVVVHPGDRVTVDFLGEAGGDELPPPRKLEKP